VPQPLELLSFPQENSPTAPGRLLCLTCKADVTPTYINPMGWLYCVLSGHQMEAVDRSEIDPLTRALDRRTVQLEAMVEQAWAGYSGRS